MTSKWHLLNATRYANAATKNRQRLRTSSGDWNVVIQKGVAQTANLLINLCVLTFLPIRMFSSVGSVLKIVLLCPNAVVVWQIGVVGTYVDTSNPIGWWPRLQKVPAMSAKEAEWYSIDFVLRKCLPIKQQLEDLQFSITGFQILNDNQSTIAVCNHEPGKLNARTNAATTWFATTSQTERSSSTTSPAISNQRTYSLNASSNLSTFVCSSYSIWLDTSCSLFRFPKCLCSAFTYLYSAHTYLVACTRLLPIFNLAKASAIEGGVLDGDTTRSISLSNLHPFPLRLSDRSLFALCAHVCYSLNKGRLSFIVVFRDRVVTLIHHALERLASAMLSSFSWSWINVM